MPKKLRNPIEVTATIHFDEGTPDYHIDDVSIHYGVSCEHGLSDRKGRPLEKNQEIQNIVKDFIEEAIKQAEVHEVVAAEDSMLDANGKANYVPEPEPSEPE